MTQIKKNDFIEIEFTARVKDTQEVFDTNIKEDAEKAQLNIKEIKPFVLSVGHNMLIQGLDKDLEGKEIGKKYTSEFNPEQAFGKRNPGLVRMIPLKAFTEQRIMPQKGMQLSLDGMVVKIISVSGGRVLVDFNNPLAGKNVIYEYKANKIIEDVNEKINAVQDFFFRQRFEFSVKEKEITFKIPEKMMPLMQVFEKPFDEILGMKIKGEILPKEEKKKE